MYTFKDTVNCGVFTGSDSQKARKSQEGVTLDFYIMKFAKSLVRNQVPEWSQWYIDYKGLKKMVRQAMNETHKLDPNDEAKRIADTDRIAVPFFYAIDRNLEIVDSFYNSKYTEYTRRLVHLKDKFTEMQESTHYNNSNSPNSCSDTNDNQEMVAMLLELRAQFRNLQWYADVNKRGFTKILKKFDKKVGTRTQSLYITSKIQILGFFDGQDITSKIDSISEMLQVISPEKDQNGSESVYDIYKVQNSSHASLLLSVDDRLVQAVDSDDAEALLNIMQVTPLSSKQKLHLLLRAISLNSDSIIPIFVEQCTSELCNNVDGLSDRTILHKAVLYEGRRYNSEDPEITIGVSSRLSRSARNSGSSDTIAIEKSDQDMANSIRVFLAEFKKHEDTADILRSLDRQLRTPLHYAVKYNLINVATVLLLGDPACLEIKDCDGHTPIDMAVLNKNHTILSELLDFNVTSNPNLLLTAAHLNAEAVCDVLIQKGGYDINYQDEHGETALHIAVKENHTELVAMLVKNGAGLEIREYTYGWTPLFIAVVDGFADIFDILVNAGALTEIVDSSGWSPKEHAALRGHLTLARRLELPKCVQTDDSTTSNNGSQLESVTKRTTEDHATQLKTFGHKYLDNEKNVLVLVTLGSRDLRCKDILPVQLDSVPISEVGKTQLDTALSLVVSATNSSSEPFVVDLPVPELGMATEPIPFFTSEPEKLQIMFDLVPTYSADSKPLARGVFIAPKTHRMQDLNRVTQCVPILESSTLRNLGQVNFEILSISPFAHPNNGVAATSTYWRSLISTRVIGHRGLGKNTLEKSSLQLGENTIESFIQASNLGASYVEFDVQLTKDNVPVIYHDFLVGDSGFDIPMHAMTLEQFMHIQEPVPQEKRGRDISKKGDSEKSIRPKRSSSVRSHDRQKDKDSSYEHAVHRMRHTRDFKTKGYKGNVRGLHIQSKFATLEELFDILPEGLGFNIEFKYPMLDEAQSEDMDGTIIEINRYVDTILEVIFNKKKHRDIILSSFNPDVCILLSLKQPSIPVLFLTESGTEVMQDIRASSLQEAVRFATRFNLLGLVSAAEPLIMCPRLVRVVKESGLVLFTYGTPNNNPENSRLQLQSGVDAVIVDSVSAVKNGFTELVDSRSEGSDDSPAPGVGVEKLSLQE